MAEAQVLNTADTVARVRGYLVGLQARITDALEAVEGEGGARFLADAWSKPPGEPLQGDGITKIMEGGRVFERAGCGFSHVRGPQLPPSATQHRPELAGAPFEAMGVSLVFHPRNPYVPTVHMNVRMIAAGHPGQAPTCWFGGGMDLTPYYGFEEDAVHFHRTCRDALEAVEGEGGARFLADAWSKPPGEPLQGDGITKIMEGGRVFERAGCGFSHVRGPQLPPSATQHRPELAGAPFEAMGVSLVFHPRNPYVPTVHMNVRMIAAGHPGQAPTCWFGGGMDLTPYYGFEEDAVHFHRTCRDALAPFGEDKYPRFKQWCDEYFFLKHRNEQRGVGGVFFDDFSELGFEQSLAMTQSVGDAFLSAYLPIVERRQATPYGERERDFQLYRRGRYVEFNLVWDRGTHFGLQSGGRTESILLSMPPLVAWSYQRSTEPGSPEAALMQQFLVRREWL